MIVFQEFFIFAATVFQSLIRSPKTSVGILGKGKKLHGKNFFPSVASLSWPHPIVSSAQIKFLQRDVTYFGNK